MKTLRYYLIPVLFLACTPLLTLAQNQDIKMKVKSDSRVDLMSIVYMLAGNPEYSRAISSSYKDDIMKHFGKFKEHEAIKIAAGSRKSSGVSYDAVMSMAVHLKDAASLEMKIPFAGSPEKLDKRWNSKTVADLLNALKQFVADTDFQKFIDEHSQFRNIADQRLEELIKTNAKLGWYDSFFGKRAEAEYILVPGYLTGGGNYGVGFKDTKNGIDELYSVISFHKTDEQGFPLFDISLVPTVIHEFCHSFVNPVVEKHMKELKKAGEIIFPFVSKKMSEQAYSQWSTMMIESVVRASVNRYLRTNAKEGDVITDIKYNTERGFIWINKLSDLFDEYENNRNKYKNLDEFFPRIVEFFNSYSEGIKDSMAEIEKEKESKLKELKEKGPKIVSISPANDNMSVDPAVEFITITFDREMEDNTWAFMIGNKSFPKTIGRPFYDEAKRILKLKIKLEPNTEYDFWLNSESGLSFRSKEGIALFPVYIKFKTR